MLDAEQGLSAQPPHPTVGETLGLVVLDLAFSIFASTSLRANDSEKRGNALVRFYPSLMGRARFGGRKNRRGYADVLKATPPRHQYVAALEGA